MRPRTALELGDIAEADDALERCSALAADLRQPFYVWQTLVFRARNAIAEGHRAEGEGLALRAFEAGQRVAPRSAATAFGAHVAVHHLLTGRLDEMLSRVKDRAESLPEEPVWQAGVAWSSSGMRRL